MTKDEEEVIRLPRFSYQVPPDLTAEFVNEMKRDLRETPSDLLTAILRKYFSGVAHAEIVGRLNAEALLDDQRRVPNYGVRPAKSEVESSAPKKVNQE